MIPTRPLDISYADLGLALRLALTADAASQGPDPRDGSGLGCLSVRTGFDLMLQALALPPGSEVLVSAVEIADMHALLEAHGLVAVPVDIDPDTLAPTGRGLELGLTRRTRAILVAHLFGSRANLSPVVAFAKRHQLLLWEDAAQAYTGPGYLGDPSADVSMFSFGKIKTHTAVGGALLRVRDGALRERMLELEARYPQQSSLDFARQALTLAAIKGLSSELAYTALGELTHSLGSTPQRLFGGATRGFSGRDLLSAIRRRPCRGLLALLHRRLADERLPAVERRIAQANAAADILPRWLWRPGASTAAHSYWLYPACVSDPGAVCAALQARGIDAVTGSTRLGVIPTPTTHPQCFPEQAHALMSSVVYLPVHEGTTQAHLERLAFALSGLDPQIARVPSLGAGAQQRWAS